MSTSGKNQFSLNWSENQTILPPLMPFLGRKRKSTSRSRDANETVEAAIAKQLGKSQFHQKDVNHERIMERFRPAYKKGEETYSPSTVGKKRLGSSLCQGPITSSLVENSRRNPRRSKPPTLSTSNSFHIDFLQEKQPEIQLPIMEDQVPATESRRSPSTKSMKPSQSSQVSKDTSLGQDLLLDELDEEELETGVLLMSNMRLGSSGGSRRLTPDGQAIEMESAISLKLLLLGSATKVYPDGWLGQSFTFQKKQLKFGLVQRRGGPCGVLAVVQSFILKQLIFNDQEMVIGLNIPSTEQCQSALVDALTHILLQAVDPAGQCNVTVALPGIKCHFQGCPGLYKADGVTENLCLRKFTSAQSLKDFITDNVYFFTADGNSSLIAFLCSLMLTRGLDTIKGDMDMDSPLMGAHGYCSQEMVHLCLLGKAISNTFDGDKVLDKSSGFVLKGITNRSEIGLLSLFEHYDSIVVGDFLKTPNFPIWLICSESHFTVLFGTQRGLQRSSMADKRPIDLYYYDQLNRAQESLIKLTIDCSKLSRGNTSSLISPIEHCIRTKWLDASIDWNGAEPLL